MRKLKRITLLIVTLLPFVVGCSTGRHSVKRRHKATVKHSKTPVNNKKSSVKTAKKPANCESDMAKMTPEERKDFLVQREILSKKVADGKITSEERYKILAKLRWRYLQITPEEFKKLEKLFTDMRKTAMGKMAPEEREKFAKEWEALDKKIKSKDTPPDELSAVIAAQVPLWQKLIERMTPEERKKFTELMESLMRRWSHSMGIGVYGQGGLFAKQFPAKRTQTASGEIVGLDCQGRVLPRSKFSTGNATLDRVMKLGEVSFRSIHGISRIKTIAVLPMVNKTNDVYGPEFVRHLFYEALNKLHYKVKPEKEVKQTLNWRMGITLGKQLGRTTPQKIGETLGVDALFYGYLIDFGDKITGIYNASEMRMGWKLVDVKTGEVIWGRGIGAKSVISGGEWGKTLGKISGGLNKIKADDVPRLSTSKDPMREMPGIGTWVIISQKQRSIKFAFIEIIIDKIIGGIFNSHLKKETKYAVKYILG